MIFTNDQKKLCLRQKTVSYEAILNSDADGIIAPISYKTQIDSIKDKIFELEGDLPLFPGHGPYTTVDDEQLNPFLNG